MKSLTPSVTPFVNPAMIKRYAEDTPERVPGFTDLHRMVLILLSERASENANVLVLGAGGGLELKAFAEARPDWSFVGVDPSRPMIDLALDVLGPLGSRVQWVNGYVDDAPSGLFDGATCLLTLHFLSVEERLHVLQALRLRLKPDAPLVVAHHGRVPAGNAELWLARSIAFAAGTMPESEQVAASVSEMAKSLTLLSADEEEAILREAGFCDPAMFYAGLSFRGWVAYAGDV